jgi:hypothetical protein
MSHWAQIDDNNIVVQVTVGNNDEADEGYQWLIDNLGGTWIKTSYNTHAGKHDLGGTPLRKNYAGIGFTYDRVLDAFIPPKPADTLTLPDGTVHKFAGWKLNEETCNWEEISSENND